MTKEDQKHTDLLPTCNDCKYAIFEDYGYSNYTTEGTTFSCSKKLNPNGEFDRWYGKDDGLKFAAQCPGFVAGEAVKMDCDHENESELTPEQKEIYEKWRA